MSRVLVTGGAGFIGSRLVPCLIEDGHEVTILDNLHPQVHADRPAVAAGVKLIEADICDAATVRDAVDGVEVVVHLAAETGTGQSEHEMDRYVATNTLGTATVLRAMRSAAGAKHLVLASSRAIFGEGPYTCPTCSADFTPGSRELSALSQGQWEPACPACGTASTASPMTAHSKPSPAGVYGITKLQQEQLVDHAVSIGAITATTLRLFNVYGPGQAANNPYVGVLGTFYRAIADGRAIDLYEDGRATRDFVYIDDVADAFRKAVAVAGTGSHRIVIGSGQSVTLSQIAEAVGVATGRDIEASISGRFRIGDIRHATAGLDPKNPLGWTPTTDFATGVSRFTSWSSTQNSDSDIDERASAELRAAGVLRTSADE